MAKGVEPQPGGPDDRDASARPESRRGPRFQQLSIRNLMIALIYFAVVFWDGRKVIETDQAVYWVVLAILIGLGLVLVGIWGVFQLGRYSIVGWIVFGLGYLVVAFAMLSYFSIPSLPILVGSILYLNLRKRSTNQDALLWVLSVAADRGIPLAPGVQAFSSQSGGIFQVWTAALAELLRQGVALPDAIENVPKTIDRPASFLIRVGSEASDLRGGLRAATLARSIRSNGLQGAGARVVYLAWVVVMALAIVGFVMYFIIPKFEAIFKDFGVELPEMTRLVIGASHHFLEFGGFLILPALLLVIYAPLVALSSSGSGLPLVDRLFPRRHTILLIRGLAVVVEAGQPIGPALVGMALSYPATWVRKRLAMACTYTDHGVNWAEALYSCGLLTRSDLGVLESAQRVGNLAWALQELAESSERRRTYRLQVGSQLLFVLTILALGLMVFLIAVAFFLPLTTLILRLTQ